MEMEKELVEFLAKALVDNPDQVSVAEGGDGNEVVLKLSVAESDVGKVIGKQGRIAKAIRTVLSACASKTGARATLEIMD
jgi:predicted RNA-binding protein YlqC (UPF0109 family)